MNLTQQTWKFENGTIPEAFSEFFQTSKMERFVKSR